MSTSHYRLGGVTFWNYPMYCAGARIYNTSNFGDQMKYRRLGRTDIAISEIGFGGWGIGGATPGASSYGDTDDQMSLRALDEAFGQGITFYDTAIVYGHSEELIAKAFAGRRDKVIIASKVGVTDYEQEPDYSKQAIRASVESSLKRMDTDYLDVIQLHNPDPAAAVLDETFEVLDELKQEGKIRAVGVSIAGPADGSAIFERFQVDAVQFNLNLMDQRAVSSGLIEQTAKAGASLIARTPLCFGFLTGAIDVDMTFAENDHRSRWSREQIHAWVEGCRQFATSIGEKTGNTPAQVALRYCLSFDAVGCAIPGILTPEEATENAAASDAGPLSQDEMSEIAEIYTTTEFMVRKLARPVSTKGGDE